MNFNEFYEVIVLALATATISVTISKASIFASIRDWISDHSKWLGDLISCSYCTSHWVAIILTLIYQPYFLSRWLVVDFFVSVFTMVAIASIVSGVIIQLIPFGHKRDKGDALENQKSQNKDNLLNSNV